MSSRNIVVTGGAGFVGSHLVDTLVSNGANVQVIDSFSAGKFPAQLNPQATYHEVDVRDQEHIAPIIAGVDVVFHVAAAVSVSHSVEDPRGTHDVNVNGTLSVLEAARRGGAKRFVFVSSAAIYGTRVEPPVREEMPYDPNSPYGLHKCIGEQYVRLYGSLYQLPAAIIRPFNIYGSRQRGDSPYAGVIARFLSLAKSGGRISIEGDGEQTRDFVHVSDMVRALILASERDEAVGQTFNIGCGSTVTINDVAKTILTMCGSANAPEYISPRIGDIRNSYADISKAQKLLGWSPTVLLSEGMRELAGA